MNKQRKHYRFNTPLVKSLTKDMIAINDTVYKSLPFMTKGQYKRIMEHYEKVWLFRKSIRG